MLVSFSACSLFAPSTQNLTVSTTERDADIYVNGMPAGKGVAITSVRRDKDVAVMAKKPGYQTTIRTVSTKISRTGIVDIIGGCIWLVPFFGALAPGFFELDDASVNLYMTEETKK